MEVKGQLTSTSDPVTCPERKHKERMAELQERRRGLQALLSTRLAELRRICLQEVELTGAVPTDFPLEAGEKPTCVRRRGGTSRQGNRKSRSEVRHEDEDSQRSKPKKNLFSGALRKHNDPEHNTHIHTHHGKRTVHRGCHTDTVRSESSSTSDSPGIENDDGGSRPLLVSSGSPVVLFQNKTRRSSLHIRTDLPETLQTLKPLPLHPPPPRSQDSSSGPSEGRGGEGLRGEWSGEEGRGGAAYSDVLLDYVWGKRQQLHLQQPHSRHPIASQHELLFHGSSPEPLGAPPTYRDQRRVTRTKSCGPFLPVQQGQSPPAAIQPDPHPHLLPPAQDAQLEDATRTLHKALALEGLRDWYLRNTNGSTHPNQANGKVNAGVNTKVNWGVKGQAGGGGALQSRRRTRGVLHHELQAHQKTLTHSATSHGRYVDSSPPQEDQPSPGTLV